MSAFTTKNQITEQVLKEQLLALHPAKRIVLKFMLEGKGILSLDKNHSYEIDNQAVRDYYRKVFDITESEASTMLISSIFNLASSRNRYWFEDEYGSLSGLWFTAFSGPASIESYGISLSVRIADAFNNIGAVERDKLLSEYTKPPYLGISPRASRIFQLISENTNKHAGKHEYEVGLSYFKQLIGVADSYDDIQNFKKFVLHPAIEEIESAVGGKLNYIDVTEGRKILGFVFDVKELNYSPEFIRKSLVYPAMLLGYPGSNYEAI